MAKKEPILWPSGHTVGLSGTAKNYLHYWSQGRQFYRQMFRPFRVILFNETEHGESYWFTGIDKAGSIVRSFVYTESMSTYFLQLLDIR